MNVRDLLQDTPSERRRQPQHDIPPPPPPQHREPSRERPPSRQQQHQQPPNYPPSRTLSPPPPREYAREYAPSHHSSQRLPPPSAMVDLPEPFVKPRRERIEGMERMERMEPLPPPHEMSMRQQHGPPPSMSGQGQHIHPDHRLPPGPPHSHSQPPSQGHSHSHRHGHSHTRSSHSGQSNSSSPMYMPPPPSRNTLPPKHDSPQGPGLPPPPGHGPIPLFPTHVGPGVAPPMDRHRDSRGSSSFEQSPMYSGPPSMGRLPPIGHPGHPHEPHPPSRHRSSASGGRHSQHGSPIMSSLQRPIYDERDGGRGPHGGPPSHYSGGNGPGMSSSVGRGELREHRVPNNMNPGRGQPPPPMLTGPGAAGVHGEPLSHKERDRMDREAERVMMERREHELREREMYEREMYERERMQRMRAREKREEDRRERDREMREGPPDLMQGLLGGDRDPDNDHHRRTMSRDQQDRSAYGVHPQVRYPESRRQIEIEEHNAALAKEEERRARERLEYERLEEMNRQAQMVRNGREREPRNKERVGETGRPTRKERARESRRPPDEHGWLPDPRGPESWGKELDREWDMKRMAQRERELREREEMELHRVHPGHPHYHPHAHHPSRHPSQQGTPNPPPYSSSKASKAPRPSESGELGPHGALPPPFGSVIVERPPHKHMSKTPVGPSPGPSHMPQTLHPSQKVPIHPSGHQPLFGYPHASSPPPMNPLIAPSITETAPPKTPHPHLLPKLTPWQIGTFVYPRVPFPFLDFPQQPPETSNSPGVAIPTAGETREVHLVVYIPTGFLPTARPKRPRIWGGALIPNFSPLFPAPQRIAHLQGGMPYGGSRPHPLEMYGTRRVYTDDSDLFLCALHSGWVSWSATRLARTEGKDLRLEMRLSKEARFVGGLGAKFVGTPEGQEGLSEDDGSSLLSAGWGNGHDGSGLEILRAEFVKKGSAHKLCLPNRSQRLLEYSESSARLECMSNVRKRRRVDAMFHDDCEDFTLAPSQESTLVASRTVVLGYRQGLSKAGFKYCPKAVQKALFSTADKRSPPRKKARLSDSNSQMDVDEPSQAEADPAPAAKPGSIIVETLVETFLFAPQGRTMPNGKENALNGTHADDHVPAQRYTISLVKTSIPPPEKITEPPKSTAQPESSTKVKSVAQPTETARAEPKSAADASAPVDAMDIDSAPAKDAKDEKQETKRSEPSCADASKAQGSASATETSVPNGKHADDAAAPTVPKDTAAAPSDKHTSSSAPEAASSETETVPVKPTEPVAEAPKESAPSKRVVPTLTPSKAITTLEVLQRNISLDDLLFDAEGISVLSPDIENGARKGWKIEARTWRWATDGLTVS